jgi:hypothetical protein
MEEEVDDPAFLKGVTGVGRIEEGGIGMRSQGDDPGLAKPEQTSVELGPIDPANEGAPEIGDPSGAGPEAAARHGSRRFTQGSLEVRD